jgi:hypothetical protein
MKIFVVYESLYGNTRTIAEAIADGLRDAGDVTIGTVDVLRSDDVQDAALIVAGGPTHIHGMVSERSRDAAHKDEKHGPPLPCTDLLRDWLAQLPPGDAPAAAFDTRIDKPAWLTGSAAKKIGRLLAEAGHPILDAASFLVLGTDGPLAVGEIDRAQAWGRELGARAIVADRISPHRVDLELLRSSRR